MLVLRLLVMILSVICLMDGHAEVSSSTTGVRDRDAPVMRENVTKVETLDRKKKKKPKKSKKSKKPKKKKPKLPKPDEISSTLKMTTTTITTSTAPTTSSTATTIITTTSTTAKATTTTPLATTTISPTTVPTTITSTATNIKSSTATGTTGAGGECKATNGKPCVFPFKDDDNTEYKECKNKDGRYFWCATKVYESGKYMYWSYCPTDGSCPLPGDGECRATDNKPCVFPFKDGEKEYSECADYGGKYFWCATGTNSAGKYTAWSKCPKDGSCPLQGQNIAPVSTSAATTAASTTTSDNIESTSTNIIVKDGDETFSCNLDFTFESEAGFKIKPNFSSSCSILGTRSSDKPYNNFDIHYFDIITKLGAKINCKINVILQDEESGVGMATKAMEKSLEYSVDNTECVTISGESFPASCVVPFIHEGREYQACTDKGGKDEGKIWCATAVDNGGVMTNWGYCSTACGYCGGKDVTSQDTRGNGGGDCGYDCFINPNKKMEPKTPGMDAKLLSPPEVYAETTMPKWNKLANDQFQFMNRDPGVFLVCKNGFNHFPCHDSIYVECIGNYRFNIYRGVISGNGKNTAIGGKTIKYDVKNVHFGCGPCPYGFDYKVGDEEPISDYNRGRYTVTNIRACGDLCNRDKYCNTFVFSSQENYCELNAKRVENPSNPKQYKDYRLCTKEVENLCSSERCAAARKTKLQGAYEGDKQNNKIVTAGGEETDHTKYPWMASLLLKQARIKRQKPIMDFMRKDTQCSGSIISCNKIITAKHCIMKESKVIITGADSVGKPIYKVTKYELMTPSNVEVYVGSVYYKNSDGEGFGPFLAAKIYHIQDAKDDSEGYGIGKDIVIIQLKDNLVLDNNPAVKPIKISFWNVDEITDTDDKHRSTEFYVAGWGLTVRDPVNGDTNLIDSEAFKVTNQLKIVPKSNCRGLSISDKFEICTKSFAGNNPAADCPGDSGGPGVVFRYTEWHLHAIVNRGVEPCNVPNNNVMANVWAHKQDLIYIRDNSKIRPTSAWTVHA